MPNKDFNPEDYKPNVWDRLWNKGKESVHNTRYNLACRSLSNQLNSILEIAKGYENAGLPAGDQKFVGLHSKAQVAVFQFAKRWDVSEEDVVLSIPGLMSLENLSKRAPSNHTVSKAIFVLGILLPLLGMAITIALAYYTRLFHFLTR